MNLFARWLRALGRRLLRWGAALAPPAEPAAGPGLTALNERFEPIEPDEQRRFPAVADPSAQALALWHARVASLPAGAWQGHRADELSPRRPVSQPSMTAWLRRQAAQAAGQAGGPVARTVPSSSGAPGAAYVAHPPMPRPPRHVPPGWPPSQRQAASPLFDTSHKPARGDAAHPPRFMGHAAAKTRRPWPWLLDLVRHLGRHAIVMPLPRHPRVPPLPPKARPAPVRVQPVSTTPPTPTPMPHDGPPLPARTAEASDRGAYAPSTHVGATRATHQRTVTVSAPTVADLHAPPIDEQALQAAARSGAPRGARASVSRPEPAVVTEPAAVLPLLPPSPWPELPPWPAAETWPDDDWGQASRQQRLSAEQRG